jgi:hypothetical protein
MENSTKKREVCETIHSISTNVYQVPLILRPFRQPSLVKADIGEPWRFDWGGHDPATPQAELIINFHSSIFPAISAVCTHALYLAKRFW